MTERSDLRDVAFPRAQVDGSVADVVGDVDVSALVDEQPHALHVVGVHGVVQRPQSALRHEAERLT